MSDSDEKSTRESKPKFAEHHRLAIADPIFVFIDECYKKLAVASGLSVRQDQVKLSKEICKAIVSNVPLIAEAPTGTGKTIAYLIGALAASEKLSLTSKMPIVIATGTIGLQSQIITGDIPKLVEAGIVPSGSGVIAKGRSRYFCINSAIKLNMESPLNQLDIFNSDANTDLDIKIEVERTLALWNSPSNEWRSGDVDAIPGGKPVHWNKMSAESGTCIGHKCDYYSECPFFKARQFMATADLIIANHDLVLSDLAMAKEEMDPLFPSSKYIVIFDECHNLPEKAIQVGSSSIDINEALNSTPTLIHLHKTLGRISDVVKFLESKKIKLDDIDPNGLENGLNLLKERVLALGIEDGGHLRFTKGNIPKDILEAAEIVKFHSNLVYDTVYSIGSSLKSSNLAETNPTFGGLFVELLTQISSVSSVLSQITKGAEQLCNRDKVVRWAQVIDGEPSIFNAPTDGSEVLREVLWGSERAVTSMVSATLSDSDGFSRFRKKAGVPEYVTEMVLPPIFPYHKNELFIVNMKVHPRFETMDEYLNELKDGLKSAINLSEGTLILFKSADALKKVVPHLKEWAGDDFVLAQRSMALKLLLATHRQRIEEGQGSILCGLATMAEGLDLPGNYCTHVIICGIPFSTPSSPVEQELMEELGSEYFEKRALPDAITKLIQMVGRLMRRESDRGRITIFDSRLIWFKYGVKIRNSLPSFRTSIVSMGDLAKKVRNWMPI